MAKYSDAEGIAKRLLTIQRLTEYFAGTIPSRLLKTTHLIKIKFFCKKVLTFVYYGCTIILEVKESTK